MASSIVVAGPKPSDVVFGDLIDVALDRTKLDSAEICEDWSQSYNPEPDTLP